MDPHKVFVEAARVSGEVARTRRTVEEDDAAFIEKVRLAKETVRTAVLESFEDAVMESARRGMRTADVYRFNGNDFVEDVSVLFVLKGGKPGNLAPPPGCPAPLFPELCAELAPFELVHDWDGITAGNRIVARWWAAAAAAGES